MDGQGSITLKAGETRPVRVLHVLGSLGRGGAETWLLQLVRAFAGQPFRFDIAVHRQGGIYASAFERLGCRIFPIGPAHPIASYRRRLDELLDGEGPYDAVHAHLQLFSGIILERAYRAGVRIRVAHLRNSRDAASRGLFRALYRGVMRHGIFSFATHRLAVSRRAARDVFGRNLACSFDVVTGFDLDAFAQPPSPAPARDAPGKVTLAHVGSFTRQKNHAFLVDVLAALIGQGVDARLMLCGDGEQRKSIERRISRLHLRSCVAFLGDRDDAFQLLRDKADLFVFPSLYEGLPRALVEAQAAGVRTLASDSVTREAAAYDGAVTFLPLRDGPVAWAAAAKRLLTRTPPDGARVIEAFRKRGLSIQSNRRVLAAIYEGRDHLLAASNHASGPPAPEQKDRDAQSESIPADSGHYVRVPNTNQLTAHDCRDCIYLRGDCCSLDARTPIRSCVIGVARSFLKRYRDGSPLDVLEIGCGSVSALKESLQPCDRWEGIDVQRRYQGKATLATRLASVKAIPFPDESFDIVYASQTMEHWYEFGVGFERGLMEMARVLRQQGRIGLDVPIHFHGHPAFRRGDLNPFLAAAARAGLDVEEMALWRRDSHPLAPYYPKVSTPPWFLPGAVKRPAFVLAAVLRRAKAGKGSVGAAERPPRFPLPRRIRIWMALGGVHYLRWRLVAASRSRKQV